MTPRPRSRASSPRAARAVAATVMLALTALLSGCVLASDPSVAPDVVDPEIAVAGAACTPAELDGLRDEGFTETAEALPPGLFPDLDASCTVERDEREDGGGDLLIARYYGYPATEVESARRGLRESLRVEGFVPVGGGPDTGALDDIPLSSRDYTTTRSGADWPGVTVEWSDELTVDDAAALDLPIGSGILIVTAARA